MIVLLAKGRRDSSMPAIELRTRRLQAGIREIPMTGDIALTSTQLTLHGDPADRFIAASAISLSATLVSADEKLLVWKPTLIRQDARRYVLRSVYTTSSPFAQLGLCTLHLQLTCLRF